MYLTLSIRLFVPRGDIHKPDKKFEPGSLMEWSSIQQNKQSKVGYSLPCDIEFSNVAKSIIPQFSLLDKKKTVKYFCVSVKYFCTSHSNDRTRQM